MKYKIGSTVIRIQAQDLAGNVRKCQFTITVLGKKKRVFILITYVHTECSTMIGWILKC